MIIANYGNGNIIVFMDTVTVDEGLDFDEEGQGNVNLELSSVAAADAGQLHAQLHDVSSTGNKKYGVNLISGKGWLKLSGDNDFSGNVKSEYDLDGVDLK